MALPLHQGPAPLIDRFPTFRVIADAGAVLHHLGGARRVLLAGESVCYKRHGTFTVLFTSGRGGRLQVRLPSGEVHETVITAAKCLAIKDGTRYVH